MRLTFRAKNVATEAYVCQKEVWWREEKRERRGEKDDDGGKGTEGMALGRGGTSGWKARAGPNSIR